MPICEKHGTYLKGDEVCGYCFAEDFKKNKIQAKAESNKSKKIARRKKQGESAIFKRAWKLFRKKYLGIFAKDAIFVNCLTCGDTVRVKGTNVFNTIHLGHYHPRSTHWMFIFDFRNVGFQCYNCNVNKQCNIAIMRPKLVSLHGQEAINKLDSEAEQFLNYRKAGIYKNKPDDLWILGQIEQIKTTNK